MEILIGCECSGIVRDAFRERGFDAWSCDLKPCERESPWHIQGDVIETIKSRRWDFIGVHPDCTALALCGNSTYGAGMPKNKERKRSIKWTCDLWRLVKRSAPHGYLENPLSVIWQYLGSPVQFIQPWQFGHGERKKTGLALHGLPPLMHSSLVCGREERVHKMGPSPTRKADRARTYLGIAEAMAEQWGRKCAENRL